MKVDVVLFSNSSFAFGCVFFFFHTILSEHCYISPLGMSPLSIIFLSTARVNKLGDKVL